jgi:8-oxo-dGTP pyrophosphatase MutT (NUDIX family)
MANDTTFYLAGCIITDDQKRVLMVHRNSSRRVQWEIPGGMIEPGEDARATAARELKEELGIDVEVRDQLGVKHFLEEGRTIHYTWFAAHIVGGQPEIQPDDEDDHDKWAYKSVEELKNMHHEVSANTRNFLEFVHRGDIRL